MKATATEYAHSTGQLAPSADKAIDCLTDKVVKRGDLQHVTVQKQLELIDALKSFGLGRYLIEHRCIDGFWTDYVVNHPQRGQLIKKNREGKPFSELEHFILDRAPVVLATQQRSVIFQRELQKELREGIILASVPCGVMGDLLALDYSATKQYQCVGVDIDPASLELGRQAAAERDVGDKVKFLLRDAWHLFEKESFDLLTSNGLNIYEPDDNRVVELYRQFQQSLKPGGILITSFLTPPSEWVMDEVDSKDAQLQKILFVDIIGVGFQAYRTVATTEKQLRAAGFDDIRFVYDAAHIFPAVVARKKQEVGS